MREVDVEFYRAVEKILLPLGKEDSGLVDYLGESYSNRKEAAIRRSAQYPIEEEFYPIEEGTEFLLENDI